MTWRPITRDLITLGAAVAQIVLPATLPPRVRAQLETIVPDVVQPANATFAVWLPIFASSVAMPARQLLPQRWRSTAVDDLGWGPAAPFASTALWALCIRTERYRAAQLALFAIAATAERTRQRVAALELDGQLDAADRFIAVPATSMLAAWGAAASGVNVAALVATEMPVTGPKARRALAVVAVTGLGAVAAASGRTTRTARASTRWYCGTVLWALAGIAARRPADPLLAALSTAAALAVWRGSRPQRV